MLNQYLMDFELKKYHTSLKICSQSVCGNVNEEEA